MHNSSLRFLLLQVIDPHYHQDIAKENMQELEQLVATFGGNVVEKSTQHRVHPHPATYIGPGKFAWLKETVKKEKINVIVLNDLVKSSQLFRLEQALWEVNTKIAVWDRVDLILHIFKQHAQSAEAKLQIELAQIKHIGPRIYGLGKTVLSRQGGGIGTRGLGETNIEREKRTIKRRTQQIEQELAKRTAMQSQRLATRKRSGLLTVALVGYTSAGKTTLFNALTQKQKQTHAGLFTTLDSVTGKLKPTDERRPLLISDTIGFIHNLPPSLIDAFRSTLFEAIEADILFHVIDASDNKMEEKMKIVSDILMSLHISVQPILVFNKIDMLAPETLHSLKEHYPTAHLVSAKNGTGIISLQTFLRMTTPENDPK